MVYCKVPYKWFELMKTKERLEATHVVLTNVV